MGGFLGWRREGVGVDDGRAKSSEENSSDDFRILRNDSIVL
jgi:hypothetical protein